MINCSDENADRWIKKNVSDWTYNLECPKCKFHYSPKGYMDGTSDEPYQYCPKCGTKLQTPNT